MVETVCLKRLKITDDHVCYAFGADFSTLDGEVEVAKNDIFNYRLIKDSALGVQGLARALSKIRIAIKHQVFPEVMCYQC